ncbi:MAG: crossover junction endodeoxyribonuclease RuvC [Fimbriimonadales bacterium]
MLILGIDPGLERIGYGLVNRKGSILKPVAYGLIESPRILVPDRLRIIDEQFRALLDQYKPDSVATERQLFAANKTTALDVAKALGVILLACSQKGLPWAEYTPPQVKLAVVGNGAAEKRQVQFMVTKLLGLDKAPKPDDVADALAIAICHAFQSRVSITPLG